LLFMYTMYPSTFFLHGTLFLWFFFRPQFTLFGKVEIWLLNKTAPMKFTRDNMERTVLLGRTQSCFHLIYE
jgi:hypothetical protein